MPFCPKCGNEIKEQVNYCPNCSFPVANLFKKVEVKDIPQKPLGTPAPSSSTTQPKKNTKKIVIAVAVLIIIVGILGVVLFTQTELLNLQSNTQITFIDANYYANSNTIYLRFNIYNPSSLTITVDRVSVAMYYYLPLGWTYIGSDQTTTPITIAPKNTGTVSVPFLISPSRGPYFYSVSAEMDLLVDINSLVGGVTIEKTLTN